MRKDIAAFVAVFAMVPAGASAYLSQDGTRLANGAGRCTVCATGWVAQPDGRYTCASTPTTDQPNCRPAAAKLVPTATRSPSYTITGERADVPAVQSKN